ncbi:glutamyl-tRNA reductase [Amedibacillus sp. YH-ame10]
MKFSLIGVSYKNTDISLRERCAFSDTRILSFYEQLLSYGIGQAVLLSTCNRSEVYFLFEHEQQRMNLKALFMEYTTEEIEPYLFEKTDKEAITYLFEVCGGYHSLVVGEDQILHQMKNAYELSRAVGACGKQLHKIFQSCFASIKNLKATTEREQKPLSIAYLAMQQLKENISLQDKTMMIIGNGEMAELMRTYAKEENLKRLLLCNRTKEHIQIDKDIEIIPFEERYQVIQQCDVICSATASPHIILKKDNFPNIHKLLYMIDLAIPRDIDTNLRTIEHVHVLDMDDLKEYARIHLSRRVSALQTYHEILEKDIEELWKWLQHHSFDETILTLQKRSEEMATQTYDLLKRKLTLSSHEEYVLKKVLHSSFMRLIKEPVMQLKKLEQEDQKAYQQMLEMLFQGDDEQ